MKVDASVTTNPKFLAFEHMLSAAEGTTVHGYATAFGGGKIDSLADHPRVEHSFAGGKTSAAGLAQWEKGTWDAISKQTGVKDFSPQSQQINLAQLAENHGALSDILAGNFAPAIQKLGSQFASFPTSAAGQPKRSWGFMSAAAPGYVKQQAMPAQMTPPAARTQGGIAPAGSPTPAVPSTDPVATSGLPSVPATGKDPVGTIFGAVAKPPAIKDIGEPTPEQHQQMAEAVEKDATQARGEAQAKFFNEPYTPHFDLPPALDDTINRYLAQL